MPRSLDEAIASIESAESVAALTATLQGIVEELGFASFAFIDTATTGLDDPLLVATNPAGWEADYRREGFVYVDPCLAAARRTNVPFKWTDLSLPEPRGRRVPGALKTMRAARDHGYREGVVVPFHYADSLGRTYASVCTFFWKNTLAEFRGFFQPHRHTLHMILLYWAQRVIDLSAQERRNPTRFLDTEGNPLATVTLTDRERDVLSWAARGKTVDETAVILGISIDTAETHVRNALRKLGASNKTQGTVTALYLGLIDI